MTDDFGHGEVQAFGTNPVGGHLDLEADIKIVRPPPPDISLSKYFVLPGSTEVVTGTFFKASTSVALVLKHWGSASTISLGTITTDSSGDFTDPVVIPLNAPTGGAVVDASGTNTKELGLWTSAGITAVGQPWYFSSGQGMGATLLMTDNLNAYTLSDIATWVAYSSTFNGATDKVPDLTQLVRGDAVLLNPYHVIRIPGANNMDGALLFENYITSDAGQAVIGAYGLKQYGVSLFTADYKTATSTPIAVVR